MKIKEKIKNGKEKVSNWWKENKNVFICWTAVAVGNIVVGSVCYLGGKHDGSEEMYKEWIDQWPDGADTKLDVYRNENTGKIEGIWTKNFTRLILS